MARGLLVYGPAQRLGSKPVAARPRSSNLGAAMWPWTDSELRAAKTTGSSAEQAAAAAAAAASVAGVTEAGAKT